MANEQFGKHFEEYMDKKFEDIKDSMIRGKEFKPQSSLLFHYPKCEEREFGEVDIPFVEIFFRDEKMKALFKKHIREAWELTKSARTFMGDGFEAEMIAVTLITDAYMVQVPKGGDENIKASTHPNREECILLTVQAKGNTYTRTYKYVRGEEGVVFDPKKPETIQGQPEGKFAGLYPE